MTTSSTDSAPVAGTPGGSTSAAPVEEREVTVSRPGTAQDHPTKGDRFSSFDVADFAVPHGRDEDWRFTPLRRLRGLHDGTAAPADRTRVSVSVPEGQSGVTVSELPMDDDRVGRAGAPVDRVAAQAWVSSPVADVVTVAPDTQVSGPVVVDVTGAGEDVTTYGAVLVEAGAHSEAVVVLRYRGSGTHADNIEYVLGDGASLTVVVVEDWDHDAVHLSNSHALLGRDSTLRHTYACFGGDVVRSVPHVRFDGPGGDAEMLGVYFADDGQYFEQRLLVDHSVPNCRSNVLYKGALQGDPDSDRPEARTAWIGDVLIRPDATGTDTYEKNNNLVLTRGARADAVPNLEIQTGEIVGAGHAATVGRFDDEHMFYLRSRGIPADTARQLIVRGFFTDVIRRIPVGDIRDHLEDLVERELESTVL
ncbi:Fe-S cluster assembly protein SufD [Corynebacterium bovis]|uniref:Fe-S cluster assembly protein SufD n=1 Tax=Corynebacterium bovis TaxID=36808 RepID=UPI0031399BD1